MRVREAGTVAAEGNVNDADVSAEYERLSKLWSGFLDAVAELAAETDPRRVRSAAAELSQRLPAALGARICMVALMQLEVRRREREAAPLRVLEHAVARLTGDVDPLRAHLGFPPLSSAAPPKPAAVKPGQVWRCVGVEGDLEVCEAPFVGWPREIGLRPLGGDGPATVRARDGDMLGLKEWSFVRGSR